MTFEAISGETKLFLEVWLSNYRCTLHKLQFDIYIAYVSWRFENTLYDTKIDILTIVSICVQGQLWLEIENLDLLQTRFNATNLVVVLEF